MNDLGFSPLGAQATAGAPVVPAVSAAELDAMAGSYLQQVFAAYPAHEMRDSPSLPVRLLSNVSATVRAAGQRLINRVLERVQARMLGDPDDLSRAILRDPRHEEVGWGVAFHCDVPPAVRAALQPLVKHRKGRVLPDWQLAHIFSTWLSAAGVTEITPDTTALPYYLLFVGGADLIPFDYTYEIARIRAVGRLDLGTDPAPYQTYVETVLAHEDQPLTARRVLFADAQTDGDEATKLSARHLVPALVPLPGTDDELKDLRFEVDRRSAASAATLKAAVAPQADGRAPALAFLATHGAAFASGDRRPDAEQGAWICSDWKGGPIQRTAYLAAADVGPGFHAPGSIVFSLACFGAGTSRTSEYARYYNPLHPDKLDEAVAPRSFVAPLPRALLSYRQGDRPAAALACVGHVDLSWATFWDSRRQRADVSIYKTFVRRLLRGDSVGMAANAFGKAVSEYNARLTGFLSNTGRLDERIAAGMGDFWIGRNHAQGFIVLGDPAVRIDPAKLP